MENADFAPTASWMVMRLRAALLRRAREFFLRNGFLEVETPTLSADVVVDRHLEPFRTEWVDDPVRPTMRRPLWLQTSPEFAMKRLLASGAPRIYQITRAFRNAEQGRLHNPEFTMIEWYAEGWGMAEGMACLADLADELLLCGPAETLSYAESFARHAGIDPHPAGSAEFRERAKALRLDPPAGLGDDVDGWRDWFLTELVEPRLGRPQPTILYDYPASQAALAQVRPGPPDVAERFELYIDGLELANGYHELLDADVLRQRQAAQNACRLHDGRAALPENNRLLAAMEHGLPPCTGVALGLDRVLMLASGARSIREVLAFAIDEA